MHVAEMDTQVRQVKLAMPQVGPLYRSKKKLCFSEPPYIFQIQNTNI